jgi:hypothetical protein
LFAVRRKRSRSEPGVNRSTIWPRQRLLQVIALRSTATPLAIDRYQDVYNSNPADVYQAFNSGLDAL